MLVGRLRRVFWGWVFWIWIEGSLIILVLDSGFLFAWAALLSVFPGVWFFFVFS
jgi:hypothetical protein